MASANGDDSRQDDRQNQCPKTRTNRQEEENPFIAFRRYADEHILSLLQSITGLPSAVFPPSSRDWMVFNDEEFGQLMKQWRRMPEEDYRNSSCQHTGGCNDNGHTRPNESDDRGLWSPKFQGHVSHTLPGTVFDSAFDNLWPVGAFGSFHSFNNLAHSPFAIDFLPSTNSAAWPVPYIMFSPYSPLILERQRQFRLGNLGTDLMSWVSSFIPSHDSGEGTEPDWRAAFEDLLRMENGKEMLDRNGLRKRESGKEWLSGMINRGSLGDAWTYVPRSESGRGDYFKFHIDHTSTQDLSRNSRGRREADLIERDEAGIDEINELDLYETFLRQVNERTDRTPETPLLSMIMEAMERRQRELQLELLQHQYGRKKEKELELVKQPSEMGEAELGQPDLRQLEMELSLLEKEKMRRFDALKKGSAEQQSVEEEAELDQLERLSDAKSADSKAQTTVSTFTNSSYPWEHSSDIVSTVKTTESRTLPDGSVLTKVIIQKRHADGREENYETEEVLHGNQAGSRDASTMDNGSSGSSSSSNKDGPNGGWFWRK